MLSKDFFLSEFTTSKTALRLGIDNTPSDKQKAAIQKLVDAVLQPARYHLGMVITIASGFRCEKLNNAVGGSDKSQHSKGEAADIECNDNAKLFNWIRETRPFDQLIWEFGNNEQPDWVHVSYKEGNNRMEVLRATKDAKGKTVYVKF